METGLMIFENEQFGRVRTVIRDGEPLFVAADVCRALDIGNPTDALSRLDDDEKALVSIEGISRGNDKVNLINEPGLYVLVLGSRKQEAKSFKRWIAHEVIPSIRKHGAYLTPETLKKAIEDPQFTIGLLTELQNEQERNRILKAENSLLVADALEWADRSVLVAIIRQYSKNVYDDFARGWNDFKKELLYKHGINLNSRITKYLNDTGKRTKPKTTDMLDDSELPNAISTAVALCRERSVDISEILKNAA